jgi:hypothetical protein
MENLHLIPTDKPSRLGLCNNKLTFLLNHQNILVGHKNYPTIYQNMYITSDKEIKEGDLKVGEYYLYFNKVRQFNKIDKLNRAWKDYKKIILTTDQDLIKDGVQAIDDTFLEWFVKNPSCEWVEVENTCLEVRTCDCAMNENCLKPGYKIIIPEEEPKQEKLTYTEAVKKEERIFNSIMMKQETLEEAAEKYVKSDLKKTPLYWLFHDTFKDGAKWQAKRMYSEEDMINFHKWAYQKNRIEESDKTTKELLKEWFEQFKNK